MIGYLKGGSRDEEAESPLVLCARYLAWSGSWRFFTGEASAIPFRREPYPTAPLSGHAEFNFGGRTDEDRKSVV